MLRSKAGQEALRSSGKTMIKSAWNGGASNIFTLQMLSEKEIRDAWGISEDDFKSIQAAIEKQLMSPENADTMKEMEQLATDEDFFNKNDDPKKLEQYFELQTKMMSAMTDIITKETEKTLSPEQKKKIQEFQLASMGEFPIVSTQMFNALGLSEEQTKKIDSIKKELDPHFEKLTDDFIDTLFKLDDKVWALFEKEKTVSPDNLQSNGKTRQEFIQQVVSEDAEFQKLSQELQSKNQLFITQLKFKIFDILTDEQLAQLEKIVNNQPDYVKNWIQKMKELMGQASGISDVSNAFLNSWKPGEPIPAEYKKSRENKKFPAKE
ncbi:hypothetical protein FACS189427_08640 [Planctomycetales bacterium]|nr:hypothetical protein FACS189427_08640 [Planctomycetales bacterium]